MIRVTTHVYPRRTLCSPSHCHYPSCILYLPLLTSRSLGPVLVLLLVCSLLSVFDSCMAFRLEDTILALIRPTSCTIRLYLVCFCLSRYHHTHGYRLLWLTDQLRLLDYLVAALLLLLAELKHAPMARQLSSCRLLFIALFQALFLLVSDCILCCRLVQIVAPGLPCLWMGLSTCP